MANGGNFAEILLMVVTVTSEPSCNHWYRGH